MRIILYSHFHFEPWDWTNSVEQGIGGSETSAVEMAWRLARRGHEVICYAPVPWEGTREWRGTTWTHHSKSDFALDGLWVIYRHPDTLDHFGPCKPSQPRWFMCQDAHYGAGMTPERMAKIDKCLALCEDHAEYLSELYPPLASKMWVTTNGVKCDLIREIEAAGPIARNPKKLVYASSPDRGLSALLDIFPRAREIDPELELHVFYGFHNIDLATKKKAGYGSWQADAKAQKAAVLKKAKQPGVHLRGRVSQLELYREWLSAGLWVYPTEFTETSCITCMEAQALGAIPIFHPLWALRTNVGWGLPILGSPSSDALVQARYVGAIIQAIGTPEVQATRASMMEWARVHHNWDRAVDQWEAELLGLPNAPGQFLFQHKHAQGRILNVGADADVSGFALRGAVNLDVAPVSALTGLPNRFHVLHDIREQLPDSLGQFETIVLGEILEHIPVEAWPEVLANCHAALVENGRLVMTCPNDQADRRLTPDREKVEYTRGCPAYHLRGVSGDDLTTAVQTAGFVVGHRETLDYTFYDGTGLVCHKSSLKTPIRKSAPTRRSRRRGSPSASPTPTPMPIMRGNTTAPPRI